MADPVFSGEEGSEDSCQFSDVSLSSGEALPVSQYHWKLVEGDCRAEFEHPDHSSKYLKKVYADSAITVCVPTQDADTASVTQESEHVEDLTNGRFRVSPAEGITIKLQVRVTDGKTSFLVVKWPKESML